LCGQYKEDLFKRSYGFLEDYKKSEMEDIKKTLVREKNADEKQRLHKLLSRMVQIPSLYHIAANLFC
jgi:ribosomal RNA-processing protein 36